MIHIYFDNVKMDLKDIFDEFPNGGGIEVSYRRHNLNLNPILVSIVNMLHKIGMSQDSEFKIKEFYDTILLAVESKDDTRVSKSAVSVLKKTIGDLKPYADSILMDIGSQANNKEYIQYLVLGLLLYGGLGTRTVDDNNIKIFYDKQTVYGSKSNKYEIDTAVLAEYMDKKVNMSNMSSIVSRTIDNTIEGIILEIIQMRTEEDITSTKLDNESKNFKMYQLKLESLARTVVLYCKGKNDIIEAANAFSIAYLNETFLFTLKGIVCIECMQDDELLIENAMSEDLLNFVRFDLR